MIVDLERRRSELLELRERVLGAAHDIVMGDEDDGELSSAAGDQHLADHASEMLDREVDESLEDNAEQLVRDIDEASAWYGQVLGLKHLYTFGKLAFFDLGGTRLLLSAESGAVSPESILYLRVDDIGSAHAELAARGVEFKGAPHLIHRHADGTEEWMAFFTDPEGRPLALMSQVRSDGG